MNTRVLKGVRYPDSRQSQVGTIMIPDVGYWPLRWMRRSPQRSSAPAISAPAISAPSGTLCCPVHLCSRAPLFPLENFYGNQPAMKGRIAIGAEHAVRAFLDQYSGQFLRQRLKPAFYR
jgi:hypothetical protein